MYEGAPDWPQKDRFWSLIERYGVTIFYTAPTAIRAFMRWGTEFPEAHDLSSLRLIGSVGEPINPEAWVWYYRTLAASAVRSWTPGGRPRPAHHDHAPARRDTLRPGSASRPFPGIAAEIRNEGRQHRRRRRPACADPAVAIHAARHLRRSRSLRSQYWHKVGTRRLLHR